MSRRNPYLRFDTCGRDSALTYQSSEVAREAAQSKLRRLREWAELHCEGGFYYPQLEEKRC